MACFPLSVFASILSSPCLFRWKGAVRASLTGCPSQESNHPETRTHFHALHVPRTLIKWALLLRQAVALRLPPLALSWSRVVPDGVGAGPTCQPEPVDVEAARTAHSPALADPTPGDAKALFAAGDSGFGAHAPASSPHPADTASAACRAKDLLRAAYHVHLSAVLTPGGALDTEARRVYNAVRNTSAGSVWFTRCAVLECVSGGCTGLRCTGLVVGLFRLLRSAQASSCWLLFSLCEGADAQEGSRHTFIVFVLISHIAHT